MEVEENRMKETLSAKVRPGRSLAALHVAVMLFGLSAVLGRGVSAPAVLVAAGRVLFSSAVLLALTLREGKLPRLCSRRDYALALGTGAVLAVHWTTFFLSVQTASVAVGTITFSAFPLYLTFLEPLFYRERLRAGSILNASVLLAGVAITIPEFSFQDQIAVGAAWGMLSGFAYALMSLANRTLSVRYSARTICLYEQGAAAVLLSPALLLAGEYWSLENFAGIAAIGVVCTALAHTLYVAGQKGVRAQTAGIVSGMESVYGILYALVLLGQRPTLRELVGGAVVLLAALTATLRANSR